MSIPPEAPKDQAPDQPPDPSNHQSQPQAAGQDAPTPDKLPRMAAALVPRELATWSLSALGLAALEGGLLGVIVKNQFADVAQPVLLNFCVALVAGAPAYANLSSFLAASLAAGRDKIMVLSRLLMVVALCLLVMSVPGPSVGGLVVFSLMAVLGRMAWSGVLTVRAAVWRANYQREWRARVTARMVRWFSVIIAAFGALIGYALDWSSDSYRYLFPFGAIAILVAARVYRNARMRRHGQLIRSELAEAQLEDSRSSFHRVGAVLREDRDFRRYMIGMLMFGSGNLMVIPIMVIVLNEQFAVARLVQVMVLSSLPLVSLCFSIGAWARLLDKRHIFEYRAVHSWFYVATIFAFSMAAILQQAWLLWPAAICQGVAMAGGRLGWNLGHNDFSSDARASLYMSIHVTLTGMRGLIAPLVGVAFYQYLSATDPQLGPWALVLPLTLSLSGSIWFVHLNRERSRR